MCVTVTRPVCLDPAQTPEPEGRASWGSIEVILIHNYGDGKELRQLCKSHHATFVGNTLNLTGEVGVQ